MAKIEKHILSFLSTTPKGLSTCWHIARALGEERKHLESVKRAAKRLYDKGEVVLFYDEVNTRSSCKKGCFGGTSVLGVALPGKIPDEWKEPYKLNTHNRINLPEVIIQVIQKTNEWVPYRSLIIETGLKTGDVRERSFVYIPGLSIPRSRYIVEPRFYLAVKRAIHALKEKGIVSVLTDYHSTKGIKITYVKALTGLDRGNDYLTV